METEYIAADAVVEELVREGVEIVFGIVSIHNMPIYDAILRDGRIQTVSARGESGAVNMADGYARATGKLGVAITSTGAGAGNAAGALTEAWNAGVPILHLTGEVASSYLGTERRYIHECKDQLSIMEGACKTAYILKNPGQVSSLIRRSILEAKKAPAGPVTVEIPIDFQSTIISNSDMIDFGSFIENSVFAYEEIKIPEDIVLKITQAKRPIIWTGGGVIASGASKEVQSLAEKIGAPVITSQSGKGSIPEDHPLCIGFFVSHSLTQEMLQKSDLLISIGVHFRGNETSNWSLSIPDEHISIDANMLAFNRSYPVTYGLAGDAKYVLTQLNQLLSNQNIKPNNDYMNEVKDVRNQVRIALQDTLGPYEPFANGMRRLLPDNSILVRDVTVPASVWGNRLIDIYEPRTSIYASGGGIGQGLPMAIGAQLGKKDRIVVLMSGDGGFMVNVGEMATAAQERLSLIIILFDDKGYGILRGIQDSAYGRRVAVDLMSPDFEMMGKSMGFETKRIESADDFLSQLEIAIDRRKPSMIVVNMNAIGPLIKPPKGTTAVLRSFSPKNIVRCKYES